MKCDTRYRCLSTRNTCILGILLRVSSHAFLPSMDDALVQGLYEQQEILPATEREMEMRLQLTTTRPISRRWHAITSDSLSMVFPCFKKSYKHSIRPSHHFIHGEKEVRNRDDTQPLKSANPATTPVAFLPWRDVRLRRVARIDNTSSERQHLVN